MAALQITWFLLIGVLLVGYCVLDGFDLGVGFWHLFAKRKEERTAFIRSIEPFWDGNEVWLLTGGGAVFAAFPPVYATVFSGFYLALMLVLMGLIFRAVAIEFRNKVESPRWTKTWDTAFSVGSVLPSLLYGVAVGNLLHGLKLNAAGDYIGGFFALLNPYALLIGLVGLSMFVLHGALYLAVKMKGDLCTRARAWAAKTWWVLVVLFVSAAVWTGLAYLRNAVVLPVLLGVGAVVALVLVRSFSGRGRDVSALLASGAAIALIMLAVAAALFPNLVPSANDPALSLTVFNASSSRRTLGVMLTIALIGMPVVLAYTAYIQWTFRGKVRA